MTGPGNIGIQFDLFNLSPDVPFTEIRNAYLEKTFQNKFQRVIVDQDSIKEEFVKYHEAYIRILKYFSTSENRIDPSIHTPDQIFKILFNQGVYALCKDNYILAGEKFNDASKIKSDHKLLMIYLGIILTKRKNYYAAEKYFTDAIKIDPNNDDAWFYAGENYQRAGRYANAITYYEKAKSLNPSRQEIAFSLKECRKELARKPEKKEKPPNLLKRLIQYIRDAFEQ